VKKLFAILVLAALPALGNTTNRLLYVDQDGNVSSTNALALQADLAALSATNALIEAKLAAAADGYSTATQLLTLAAQSVVATPVVYASLEFIGFEAAVTFDPNSKIFVTRLEPTGESLTVNGTSCKKVVLDFGFQESLQTVKPWIEYSPQLEGAPRADWDFLTDDYVSTPTPKTGSFEVGGDVFSHLYSVDLAVPAEYTRGFFAVSIPNDAASSDGSVMDMPGMKDGYTGTQQWGGKTLTFKGGYLVGVSE
jgi:hypothetical protein